MSDFLPSIRNAARALIVREQKVLLLLKKDERGERYALPGGGQEAGETLQDALLRECSEEIGCTVTVNQLLHVADYFKERTTNPPSRRHQVEFLFSCDVPGNYEPQNGCKPDKHQIDVVWADLAMLSKLSGFPQSLVGHLAEPDAHSHGVYLGVVK